MILWTVIYIYIYTYTQTFFLFFKARVCGHDAYTCLDIMHGFLATDELLESRLAVHFCRKSLLQRKQKPTLKKSRCSVYIQNIQNFPVFQAKLVTQNFPCLFTKSFSDWARRISFTEFTWWIQEEASLSPGTALVLLVVATLLVAPLSEALTGRLGWENAVREQDNPVVWGIYL